MNVLADNALGQI